MTQSGKEKAAESRAMGRLGENLFEWQQGVIKGKELVRRDQRRGKGGFDYWVDGVPTEVKSTSTAQMTAKQRKTNPKLVRMNIDKTPGTGSYIIGQVIAEKYQKNFKRKKI